MIELDFVNERMVHAALREEYSRFYSIVECASPLLTHMLSLIYMIAEFHSVGTKLTLYMHTIESSPQDIHCIDHPGFIVVHCM